MLESWGYRVQIAPHAFEKEDYLAGSDALRAADLQEAFDDPDVQAVYCSRGGYGCARLMPWLDLDRMAASGKLFVGFSDITTLHLALNRRGLPTVYAPMALTFVRERAPWVAESLRAALAGESPIPASAPAGECLVPGVAEGFVTGGCLSLLADSLGTPDPLDARGRILLIEDVDENPHRVDANLTHLRLSGALEGVRGIVVGEMTGTDEKSDPSIGARSWRVIVRDRLAPLGVPTVWNFPFGHMANMLSLPLGVTARLDASAGTLRYEPL